MTEAHTVTRQCTTARQIAESRSETEASYAKTDARKPPPPPPLSLTLFSAKIGEMKLYIPSAPRYQEEKEAALR